MTTSDDFIEQFIEHYAAHDAAYKTLSRKLESECRELCSQEGIKAVVSSRTKDKERLSDKIRKRASKKANGYGSLEGIKLDIVDLCGARISLYYPADRRRVSDLVKEKFKSYAGKTHPEEDMPEAEGGDYHGINHRASREDPALGWVRIEIQIMTLLTNAWLEISHDDLYHGREGPLSPEEKALLKQINRLVLEAEENAERYQNRLCSSRHYSELRGIIRWRSERPQKTI
jgi:ppGpp synthetase/RelA/SpoT-type nucleotidyltranferase